MRAFPFELLSRLLLDDLPRNWAHARIYFRDIRCDDRRADWIAETITLAWKCLVRLAVRGKEATPLVSTIATFAVSGVNRSRRLVGMQKSKDATYCITQRRRGFTVDKFPGHWPRNNDVLTAASAGNTSTLPPTATAFQIDFPRWLDSLPVRDRWLARAP